MNVRNVTERLGTLSRQGEFFRREILIELILLTVIGAVVRILVAHVFLGGLGRGYEGDEGGYMTLALRIAEGLGFTNKSGAPTSYVGPGLPLLLLVPIGLHGAGMVGIRLFLCLMESLLVPACYLLGRSVSDSRRIGLIASAIAVCFPTWIIPSGEIGRASCRERVCDG